MGPQKALGQKAPRAKERETERETETKTETQNSQVKNINGLVAEQAREALAVIFAVRLANSLCVRTFFQPDEYFQVLEPAWQLLYGENSGAWLTWVRGLCV